MSDHATTHGSTTYTGATIVTGEIGGLINAGCLRTEDGRITHVGTSDDAANWPASDTTIDLAGKPLVPGYIDIHHHGGGGAAYDDGLEATAIALAQHRKHGTARSVLSFVTAELDDILDNIRNAATLVKSDSRVLGLHPEGPFLHPSHKGAHPEALLRDPLPEATQKMLDAADGTLVQVTLAPEREGGIESVKLLAEHGVCAAVGHTSADYDTTRAAIDAGATILTHAFNGMNGIHHRAPGPVTAALRDERMWLEVINDTIHVHPAVVRSLFEEAPERVILVTDAMSATCNPDGHYMLGTLEVEVKDGVARLVEGHSLAGSTLTMDKAVANAITRVGVPVDVAVAAATSHPALAIGMEDQFGVLAPGYPADLLVLDPATFLPERIIFDGD
ncbi:N-acetylglucosamine-6-phosphate deacetylase [Corynebacterium aquilae]|uniref:N-acetylglucosamine-6-phosphate deacetylase n=1 Tax=Corynebacterium aquilae DSM 44791 TaxID=1431546 RepID=A0A1L7CIC2_9CORY|nr:N-acetylglucosamine-6-phosphate deacetylase [Corynebacterium aquilae]APT85612.1 N-acetylglucosamine-6-phosphate deacetylase [Corynebacterium aquilae DSM 44791]